MQQTLQQKGMMLASIGVLILSFDAMLIRLSGVSSWDVVFWRGWLICLVFTTLTLLKRQRIQWPNNRAHWLLAALIAALYGINTLLFVFSISNTSTANTVVILASSPLFAAIFSRLFLHEPIKHRVLLAIIASFIGVITIFAGSFNSGGWLGDIAALCLALFMGIVLTLLRRYSGLPLLPIIALSGAVAGLMAIPLASPMSLPANSYLWLAIMGLVQMPLATWLLMLAPRFIPSAEVSLFLLIETILGPVWVWLAVGEETPARTLLGGTIILSAIFANTMAALYEQKQKQKCKSAN
ncbi:DMT family transporter [Neptunomonas sp.]|uniref:DMT family transporter n=1 Tax=Neptunomonas sp. TaxID=1971898 RepID=UPI003561F8F9